MAAPTARAARADHQSSIAPPKTRTAEPRHGRPASESGYVETGGCALLLRRALRAPLATSPGSIGQVSRGQWSGRPVVRRWLVLRVRVVYGLSLVHNVRRDGCERNTGGPEPPSHSGRFVMIRPRARRPRGRRAASAPPPAGDTRPRL